MSYSTSSSNIKDAGERPPLKYSLARFLASLALQNIISNSADVATKFEKVLHLLLGGSWVSGEECDELLTQYKAFTTDMKQEHATEFSNFSTYSDDRLDVFFGQYMNNSKYGKLWRVIKMLLTISHGQASVERGYSVNSDLLIENMQEKTVVALPTVYDGVMASGSHFCDVSITPRLKRNIRSARMRDQQYLNEQKKAKADEQKAVQRKKNLLKDSIESLSKEADELAKKRKQDMTLLAKSNTFRQKASEKVKEDEKLDYELKDLKEKLKHIE